MLHQNMACDSFGAILRLSQSDTDVFQGFGTQKHNSIHPPIHAKILLRRDTRSTVKSTKTGLWYQGFCSTVCLGSTNFYTLGHNFSHVQPLKLI